jgi:hypothetical protein
VPAPRLLIISGEAWLATSSLLAPYADAQVEAGLYWYGIRSFEAAIVSVVGIPHQTNREGNFEVRDEDLAALVLAIPDELVVVAQIHTHPGSDTQHSSWDDNLAVSQKIISLVFPGYGQNPSLEDVGVHEFIKGRWSRLSPRDVADRIVLFPGVVDTR